MQKVILGFILLFCCFLSVNATTKGTPIKGLTKIYNYDPASDTYYLAFDDGVNDGCIMWVDGSGNVTDNGSC